MTRDSEKTKLLKEILDALERPTDSPLTPVVRKAARLAKLCGESEYQLLFQLHLEGFDPSCSGKPRFETWDPSHTPRWNPVEAFADDRAMGLDRGVHGAPLERLELLLREAESALEVIRGTDSLAGYEATLHTVDTLTQIFSRIRNRVGVFASVVQPQISAIGEEELGIETSSPDIAVHESRPGRKHAVASSRSDELITSGYRQRMAKGEWEMMLRRKILLTVLIIALTVLAVTFVGWVALPEWRDRPYGWVILLGIAAAGAVPLIGQVVGILKDLGLVGQKAEASPSLPVSSAATGNDSVVIQSQDLVMRDKIMHVETPVSKAESLSQVPELELKLFLPHIRTRRGEVTIQQEAESGKKQYLFGCALENTKESTIAKEIDIALRTFWKGDPPQICPIINAPQGIEGWSTEEQCLAPSYPAVLRYRGTDLRCSYGQPEEWSGFSIEVKERLNGYFDIRYNVSSFQPQTNRSGVLRIVMQ